MADEECCRISEEESNQLEAASKAVKQRRKPIPVGSGKMEHRHRAQSIIHAKALDELETEVETGLYENVDLERGSRWSVIAAEITFSKSRLPCATFVILLAATLLHCYCLYCSIFSLCRLFVVECAVRPGTTDVVLPSLCNGDQRLRSCLLAVVLSRHHSDWSDQKSHLDSARSAAAAAVDAGGCGFVPVAHLPLPAGGPGCGEYVCHALSMWTVVGHL